MAQEFRYATGPRVTAVILTLIFGAWFLATPWMFLNPPRGQSPNIPAAVLISLIPLGMTIMCLSMVGRVFGKVVADEDGIEVDTLFRKSRRQFHELDRVEPDGSSRDGYVLHSYTHRPIRIAMEGLIEGDALRAILKDRVMPRDVHEDQIEYRPEIVPAAVAVALIVCLGLIALPWFTKGPLPVCLLIDAVAIAVLLLIVRNATTRVRLSPVRVVSRSLFGEKTVRFHDVRQVRLAIEASRAAKSETITLTTPKGSLTFSAQYSQFTRLRNALIARCSEAELSDSRPVELR
ncbi:MAG: hypothetical protein ACO1SV_25525 [Fimbriimonas sp.]